MIIEEYEANVPYDHSIEVQYVSGVPLSGGPHFLIREIKDGQEERLEREDGLVEAADVYARWVSEINEWTDELESA